MDERKYMTQYELERACRAHYSYIQRLIEKEGEESFAACIMEIRLCLLERELESRMKRVAP